MNTREIRSAYQHDSTSLRPDVYQFNNLTSQSKAELVMCQTLCDSKKWQSHDQEDTLFHIDALTGIGYLSDESELEYRTGKDNVHTIYRHPFGKIDPWQRRPPYMSVFRKVWLIPIPFCMATFLCSAFWNLSQITSAWFLGELTAIIAYPLVLALLLPRLIVPILHKPLLDLKQKLASLPLIIGLAIFAGWIWLIIANDYTTISRWDLCWWCALIGITCGIIAYL